MNRPADYIMDQRGPPDPWSFLSSHQTTAAAAAPMMPVSFPPPPSTPPLPPLPALPHPHTTPAEALPCVQARMKCIGPFRNLTASLQPLAGFFFNKPSLGACPTVNPLPSSYSKCRYGIMVNLQLKCDFGGCRKTPPN